MLAQPLQLTSAGLESPSLFSLLDWLFFCEEPSSGISWPGHFLNHSEYLGLLVSLNFFFACSVSFLVSIGQAMSIMGADAVPSPRDDDCHGAGAQQRLVNEWIEAWMAASN